MTRDTNLPDCHAGGEIMELISFRPRTLIQPFRKLLALVCAVLLFGGEGALLAQEPAQGTSTGAAAEPAAEKLPPDQLDSLVAPIALYPDPLLAQTLAASTYPLELIQLQQWLEKNKNLKDKALADAVAKQPWDPSVQSMAAVPDVVKRLADDIQWTTQLGDAFLDQQNDVMEAVQRMRKKADEKGSLKSNEQQKVETKVIENKTVIVVEPTNPEVVYVPSYNPTVVYPPPVYPYPPVYYPPYTPGAALVTFGVGMAMGAAIWGGSCCGCGWGGGGNNTININNNNNFNRNTNVNRGQSGGGNRGQGGNWSHNSAHRGGAPYSNKATASKYGGQSRGQSGASARQQGAGGGRGGAGAGPSASSRGGGAGGGPSASSRGGGAGAGPSASSRGGGGGASPSASSRGGGGGGGGRSGGSSAMGGGSGGFSGSSARSSSSRGSSSMSSRGGGGGSRGGGGRGGGRR
jgi:uncharacterized protein DUF3300